jgi:hypothetical protein
MPHTARNTDYMAEDIGTARLVAGHGSAFEAGSSQGFELVFTAGRFRHGRHRLNPRRQPFCL